MLTIASCLVSNTRQQTRRLIAASSCNFPPSSASTLFCFLWPLAAFAQFRLGRCTRYFNPILVSFFFSRESFLLEEINLQEKRNRNRCQNQKASPALIKDSLEHFYSRNLVRLNYCSHKDITKVFERSNFQNQDFESYYCASTIMCNFASYEQSLVYMLPSMVSRLISITSINCCMASQLMVRWCGNDAI